MWRECKPGGKHSGKEPATDQASGEAGRRQKEKREGEGTGGRQKSEEGWAQREPSERKEERLMNRLSEQGKQGQGGHPEGEA